MSYFDYSSCCWDLQMLLLQLAPGRNVQVHGKHFLWRHRIEALLEQQLHAPSQLPRGLNQRLRIAKTIETL